MKRLIVLLLLLSTLSGCRFLPQIAGEEGNEMVETTVRTELEPLKRWFDFSRLPEPQRVQWVSAARGIASSSVPGPTDYYVLAVLEYDTPASGIAAALGLAPASNVYVAEEIFGAWLPDTVRQQFSLTPEGYLKFDGAAYQPGDLLLPPLADGYVFAIGNTIIVFGVTL